MPEMCELHFCYVYGNVVSDEFSDEFLSLALIFQSLKIRYSFSFKQYGKLLKSP